MRTSRLALSVTVLFAVACGSSSEPEQAPAPATPAAAPAPATPAAAAPAAVETAGPELPGYGGRFHDGGTYAPHELAKLDKAALRVLRNEIYARYGRAFASDDLTQHFQAQPWYQVREDYSDDLLTETDKAQAFLIKSFETDDLDVLEMGEFAYEAESVRYVFASDDMLLVIDQYDEGYGDPPEELAWRMHGEWALTWDVGEAFSGQAATLVHLDPQTMTVTEKVSVPASAG